MPPPEVGLSEAITQLPFSRLLKKSIRGLFQLAPARYTPAPRSEKQTRTRLIFDAALPCGTFINNLLEAGQHTLPHDPDIVKHHEFLKVLLT